jgi:hypothetical protein
VSDEFTLIGYLIAPEGVMMFYFRYRGTYIGECQFNPSYGSNSLEARFRSLLLLGEPATVQFRVSKTRVCLPLDSSRPKAYTCSTLWSVTPVSNNIEAPEVGRYSVDVLFPTHIEIKRKL